MLLPYECHEGNLAVRNSLSAERAEDRALAEDLAKGIKRRGGGCRRAASVAVAIAAAAPEPLPAAAVVAADVAAIPKTRTS